MANRPRAQGMLAAFSTIALLACGAADDREAGPSHEPVALADQEDAVCGMLVREQSAPRAQMVHRDGARLFFCSLGDMLVHLGAPSPHGSAVAIFVEVLEPGEDPMQSHTGEHDWVAAEDAVYVVGVARRGIMGDPVLAYADRGAAERAMAGHAGSQILNLEGLRGWWASER